MAWTRLAPKPYRSAAAVMTDLLSGQVQLYFGTTALSLEYVRTGKLRAGWPSRGLGLSTMMRQIVSLALPDRHGNQGDRPQVDEARPSSGSSREEAIEEGISMKGLQEAQT